MADATHGHLRAGVGAFFAHHVFPESLLRFVVDYPNVDVTIIEATSQDLYDALLGGELDFAISTPAIEVEVPARFESELLFETRNAIFVRAGHPLATREQVSIRDLAELPWIVSARFANYRARLESAFRAEGLEPPARIMRTDSVPVMGQILQNSDAVALLGSNPFRDLELPPLGRLKAFDLPNFSGTLPRGARLAPHCPAAGRRRPDAATARYNPRAAGQIRPLSRAARREGRPPTTRGIGARPVALLIMGAGRPRPGGGRTAAPPDRLGGSRGGNLLQPACLRQAEVVDAPWIQCWPRATGMFYP